VWHFLGLLRLLQICTNQSGRCDSSPWSGVSHLNLSSYLAYASAILRAQEADGSRYNTEHRVGPVVCTGVQACSPPEGCMLRSQVHQCHRSWVLGCQDKAGGRVVRSAERAATHADTFSDAALVRSIQGGTLSQHQVWKLLVFWLHKRPHSLLQRWVTPYRVRLCLSAASEGC